MPSWGFSLAVSGITRPEGSGLSLSSGRTSTRSPSGRSFIEHLQLCLRISTHGLRVLIRMLTEAPAERQPVAPPFGARLRDREMGVGADVEARADPPPVPVVPAAGHHGRIVRAEGGGGVVDLDLGRRAGNLQRLPELRIGCDAATEQH